jgi:CubicO group peptidase (beta-lactamase class C family)
LGALAAGQLFADPQTLQRMLDCSPTDAPGVGYGLGVYCIDLPEPLGTLYGHDGHGNSFAYFWPERQVTFVGSLNQLNNDWWPLVSAATEALR